MSNILAIKRIISKMNNFEYETLRSYLKVFDQRGDGFAFKNGKLLELISNKSEKELTKEDEIEALLYGVRKKSGTFNKLSIRLLNKILESLIIDVNIQRKGAYNEKSKEIFKVRKRISQGQVLQDRGLRELAEEMFNEAIKISRKYELYEELLLALRLQIAHKSVNPDTKSIDALLKQYDYYDKCKNAVLRAIVYHGQVIAKWDYYSGTSERIEWLDDILTIMRKDYRTTNSAEVGYYFFYIETQKYQIEKRYTSARKSLKNLILLLNSNPGIYTSMRLGGALFNLADNDLFLYRFDRCIEDAKKAITKFKPYSFNYTQGLETIMLAQFYSGKYFEVKAIIKQIKSELSGRDFRSGKRDFINSCVSFIEGEYTEALSKLNYINPIEEDKCGWNISIRIVTIMCQIELELYDEATAKIDALYSFVGSLNKESVGERNRAILFILQRCKYMGFDLKAVIQKEKEKYDLLADDNGVLSWQIKSGELIIFHQWFFSKAYKQNFIQTVKRPTSPTAILQKE